MTLEFFMGVAVARLPRRQVFGLFIPLGLALTAFAPPFLGDLEWSLQLQWALWRALEWGCPAALVVWGTLSLESLFEHHIFDAPVTLGDASYSIYLFHPLIAHGFDFFWPLRMALAIGTGLAMYMLVERRLMAARRRVTFFKAPLRNPLPG
jgi:exopolysaccharide production protein ExoZ